MQDGTFTGRGPNVELAAEANGAATQAGQSSTARAVAGGVEAPAVVADFGMQLPVLVAHEQFDPACAAVLEHVGQRLLQEAQQVEAARGAEAAVVQAVEPPEAVDAGNLQPLASAVPQWRQQDGEAGGRFSQRARTRRA